MMQNVAVLFGPDHGRMVQVDVDKWDKDVPIVLPVIKDILFEDAYDIPRAAATEIEYHTYKLTCWEWSDDIAYYTAQHEVCKCMEPKLLVSKEKP